MTERSKKLISKLRSSLSPNTLDAEIKQYMIETEELLVEALTALETDHWQKKIQSAINIGKFLK